MAEAVRVIVRFRPARHISHGGAKAVENANSGFYIRYGPDGRSINMQCAQDKDSRAASSATSSSSRARPYSFAFDAVFNEETRQENVFDIAGKEIVHDVLKGYNGTIFAYGQTGSGKTFTMFGPSFTDSELCGLIPRCAAAIFDGLKEATDIEEATIKCSFLEIYMEQIRDLLSPQSNHRDANGKLTAPPSLKVRESPAGDLYVPGLSEEYVASAADIMQLLSTGERNRHVAATDMNEVSSRSHSVFVLTVTQKLKNGSVRVGKLNLADLAGSERIERTNATGSTLDEAKKINQSLSALGNCINALTDSKRTHIPFRDSTLTFLLKDSLGGNSKTTLFVACSPDCNDGPETLSTLLFAKRAKLVKNQASVNMKLSVADLQRIIDTQRTQLTLAYKHIFALQKVITSLRGGGTVEEAVLEMLMKPPAGYTASTDMTFNLLPSSTSSIAEPTSPVSPPLSPSASSSPPMSPKTVSTVSASTVQKQDDDDDDDWNGVSHSIQQSQQSPTPLVNGDDDAFSKSEKITITPIETKETPSTPTEDTSSSTLPTSADDSAIPARLRALTNVQLTSDDVDYDNLDAEALRKQLRVATAQNQETRRKLNEERALHRQTERALRLENEHLRVEKDVLRVSSTAGEAIISNLTSAVKARQDTVDTTSNEGKFLSSLTLKNERLERQMQEMKETWSAYLDLVVENQKYNNNNSDRTAHERLLEQQKGAKIVRPIKKSGGWLGGLFGRKHEHEQNGHAPLSPKYSSQTLPAHMFPSPSSQPSSPFSQPRLSVTVPSESPASLPSSPSRASSASISSPNLTSNSNAAPILFRGFLLKKASGWTLASRSWRKRIFILRPLSIDYYEPNNTSLSQLSSATSLHSLNIQLRGTIPLDLSTTAFSVDNPTDTLSTVKLYPFDVRTRDKVTNMRAATENERNEWIAAIASAVDALKKQARILINLQDEQRRLHPLASPSSINNAVIQQTAVSPLILPESTPTKTSTSSNSSLSPSSSFTSLTAAPDRSPSPAAKTSSTDDESVRKIREANSMLEAALAKANATEFGAHSLKKSSDLTEAVTKKTSGTAVVETPPPRLSMDDKQ